MHPFPRVGSVIDATYLLEGRLGEGGAGTVFRGTHLGLQKAVAVKLLQPASGASSRYFERFRVEAEALGRLQHPGIVGVSDFGIDPQGDGVPYLVMDLVDGETLEARCAAGPLPLAAAAVLLEAIAQAIDAAHEAGIVHGDISLRNVMVTAHGPEMRPVLIDFGLARRIADDAAPPEGSSRQLAGTVGFMAPELAWGAPPSRASDLYSFGALARRVLTGARPAANPGTPSHTRAGLPQAIEALLAHAQAPAPADRPRTAGWLAEGISRAAHRVARTDWRRREVPRRAAAAAGLALAVVALQPVLDRLGWLRRAEGVAFDTRIRWSSPRPPDARLLLVSFDNRTLAADPTPLPDRADEVGQRLAKVLAGGASVVGVDLLLPEHWGRSRAFADLVLGHAPRLALAIAQEGREQVGPEAVGGLITAALGPDAARRLFASVNVEPDLDGIVRSARVFRIASDGDLQPTMAARLAGWPDRPDLARVDSRVPIDYRLALESIERVSWIDLDDRLAANPRAIEGRLVLVGADFAGSGDRHLVPRPGQSPMDVTGLEQQATIAATLLSPGRLSDPSGWQRGAVRLFLATLAFGIALMGLLRAGAGPLAVAATGTGISWVAIATAAFAGGIVLPVAVPVTVLALTLVIVSFWASFWSLPPTAR